MSNYNLTKLGLIFLIIGMIMGIIPTGIFYFVNPNNFISTIVLGVVAGIGAIFIFVALIIMWVAGIGLKEYGQKHSKFCLISLILFLVAIGAVLAGSFITAFSMVDSTASGSYSGYKTTYLLGPVSATFMGLVYLFLLHEIEDTYGKIVLYLSFIIMIVVSCIIAYIGYIGFDEWLSGLNFSSSSTMNTIISSSTTNSFSTAFTERSNQLNIYSIIPNILFLASAILPLSRILSGNLKIIPRKAVNRICSNCGFEVPQYTNTCPKCGQFYGAIAKESSSSLKFCPNCGAKNEENLDFCEECGTKF